MIQYLRNMIRYCRSRVQVTSQKVWRRRYRKIGRPGTHSPFCLPYRKSELLLRKVLRRRTTIRQVCRNRLADRQTDRMINQLIQPTLNPRELCFQGISKLTRQYRPQSSPSRTTPSVALLYSTRTTRHTSQPAFKEVCSSTRPGSWVPEWQSRRALRPLMPKDSSIPK